MIGCGRGGVPKKGEILSAKKTNYFNSYFIAFGASLILYDFLYRYSMLFAVFPSISYERQFPSLITDVLETFIITNPFQFNYLFQYVIYF